MHKVRRGWKSSWARALGLGGAALAVTVATHAPARATTKYGDLEVSGNVETQNLVRDSSPEDLQFTQNRNTLRLRVDWDWLKNSKLIDKINVPFVEHSKLFLLYRGVYDGYYDIGPTDLVHGQTRYDDLIGGRITNLPNSELTSLKFENRLREAYIDAKLTDLPITLRLGRQQVIWGESDQFRIMDIWNPLDVTWHFQQESWDNIRIPLWLGKGLWDIGEVGPLSNVFLEAVYNPGDFQPGVKSDFLPVPWSLPFPNPLRSGQINVTSLSNFDLTPVFDLQGTSLRQGNFKRNPQDASEFGTRFHFVTPHGIEMSLNYLYGRGRGVGAASPFGVKIDSVTIDQRPSDRIGVYQVDGSNPTPNINPVFSPSDTAICQTPGLKCMLPVNVKAEVVHPYMHIFGLTGNYFDGDLTNAVLRFESAYALGEPYETGQPSKLPPMAPFTLIKEDVWTGMIGFDRPTWIRWLNSKATWFLTGQFFWNYLPGANVNWLAGNNSAGDLPYFGPIGRWVSATSANQGLVGQVERQQNSDMTGNGDNVRRWEHLMTVAATSFYRSGTVVPFIADAWDFVNDNNEVLWNVDYYYNNDFIISLQQKFFMTYGSKFPSNDPWYAGGRFDRRDETGVKLTYQF